MAIASSLSSSISANCSDNNSQASSLLCANVPSSHEERGGPRSYLISPCCLAFRYSSKSCASYSSFDSSSLSSLPESPLSVNVPHHHSSTTQHFGLCPEIPYDRLLPF